MDNRIIAERYFEAYAASDWNTYKEILSEQIEYEDSGGSKLRGANELIHSIGDWKAGFPDAKVWKFRSIISEGNRVAVELVWTGTHTKTLTSDKTKSTISEELPASGRVIFHDAVMIMQISKAKKIEKIRHYYDMNDFTMQITGKKVRSAADI